MIRVQLTASVLGLCLLLSGCGIESSPTPPQRSSSQPAPAPVPTTPPQISDLRRTGGAATTEGVAAVILVDVSGSMKEYVSAANGQQARKIDVAKRCVQNLVQYVENFARESTGQKVVLGVYEFSDRAGQPSARPIVPIGPPSLEKARTQLQRFSPDGGTPIGNAIVLAKRDLNATGLSKLHILVVTDGMNTSGIQPLDVARELFKLPESDAASLYLIGFDVNSQSFEPMKEYGSIVLGASNEAELQKTLDFVMAEKILLEAKDKK